MYLQGRYKVAVDEKNRVTIPSDLRKELGSIEKFYWLYVNPKDDLFYLFAEIFDLNPYFYVVLFTEMPQNPDKNLQWVINQIYRVEINENRILIPYLRKNFGDEVYILGQNDRIEIWPPDEYDRRVLNISNQVRKTSSFFHFN